MRFLRGCFKKHKYFLLFFLIFPLTGWSDSARSIFLSESSILSAKNVLSFMTGVSSKKLLKEDLKKALDERFVTQGVLLPVICNENKIFVLWKSEQGKVVLAWSREYEFKNAYHNEQFPENTCILVNEQFDSLMLQYPELLDAFLKDKDVMKNWIPNLPDKVDDFSLKSFKPYLFKVKKPKKNYTLGAIIGEDKFFPDITEDEQELTFIHCPLLQFVGTISGENILYCKIDAEEILKRLPELLISYYADFDKRKFFVDAFQIKLECIKKTTFSAASFLKDLIYEMNDLTNKYDFSNIPESYIPDVVDNMIRFLLSNGIASFKDLIQSESLIKTHFADRFFSAKTTAFFRNWREMNNLKEWLSFVDKRCSASGRPLKLIHKF